MYLERLLQINLATMAALSALLLGMGERSLVAPLAMCTAAVLSVWLNDVTGWLRLNRAWASLGAIVALALAVRHTTQLQGETLLLSIAHLLIVLQIILLFQAKDDRIYWQIAMLSLLQVMVATLFSQGIWFGLLLVLHTLVGLSALTLLFLVRQHRPFRESAKPAAAKAAPPPRRWPLSAEVWALRGGAAGSSRTAAAPELFHRLAGIGVFTLFLSALVFFAVPRLGRTAWRGAGAATRSLVGFGDTITLGEMGEMLESRDEVLRLRLVQTDTQELYRTEPDVYLRGALLANYEKGQWSQLADGASVVMPLQKESTGFAARPPVVQRIIIEPLDRRELFCVWPYTVTEDNGRVEFDARTGRLRRSEAVRDQRFSYELGTTAFADGRQSPIMPCDKDRIHERLLKQLGHAPDLPRLKALADRWIAESGLPARDRIGRARYLEAKFRDAGLFQYSLQGQERNLALDPIEDFVSEHRVGHCEYFATALALMLRTQNIPSRVVIGYHCDEWNEVGKFFQVRQLHAHSWVEAYLKPSQVPHELFHSDDHWHWAAGAWLRLDPTPGDSDAGREPTALAGLWSQLGGLQDWWSNYVMEMDRQRQREAIYEPVLRALRSFWQGLTSAEAWRERLTALGEWLGFGANVAWWAAAILVLLGGLLAAAAIAWLVARLLRGRMRRRRAAPFAPRSAAPPVEFYQRFERLLRRMKIERRRGQTQREFAAAAERQLAARGAPAAVAGLVFPVAEAFYRVRFGRVPLDTRQSEAVEHAVAALEAALTDST